jgi:hypothetical protein
MACRGTALLIFYYIHLSFPVFLTVYPCYVSKLYAGTSKFPFLTPRNTVQRVTAVDVGFCWRLIRMKERYKAMHVKRSPLP